ncbi:MAG: prolipoprotein diacylglyceryl transferase [Lachnospiraceae bacterium]|nr:prolipoprotein diacylglyceryl transferase [Lachnospiraceae bacterium]
MTLETGKVYFSGQNSEYVLPESVSIFGFSVSLFGICLVLAAIIGVLAVVREGKKRGQNTEWLLTVLPLVFVFSVIGARIYYVIFQWYPFSKEPLMMFNLRHGGLAYFGALFGAWLAVKRYCKRKKESFERTADALCMGGACAAFPIWLGCLFMREPVGRFFEGIFSVKVGIEYLPKEADCVGVRELLEHVVTIDGGNYISMHPVPVYGAIASLVIVLILWISKRFLKQDGQLFWLYLFLNAVSVLVLEPFRASRCCIWGTEIPINSVVAGVLFVTIVLFLTRNAVKKK